MSFSRDIAILGSGLVTASGVGVETNLSAMTAAVRAAVEAIEVYGESYPVHRMDRDAAENVLINLNPRRATTGIVAAAGAAREAVDQAGLPEGGPLDIVFAATHSVLESTVRFHETMRGFASPMAFSLGVHNAPSYFVRDELKMEGRSVTLVGGAGAAFQALTEAGRMLRGRPDIPVLVVSSTEVTPEIYPPLKRFGSLGGNPGMVPGEGAAAVVFGVEGDVTGRFGTRLLEEYRLSRETAAPFYRVFDVGAPELILTAGNGNAWNKEEELFLDDYLPGVQRVGAAGQMGETFAVGPLARISLATAMIQRGESRAVFTHGFCRPGRYGAAVLRRSAE